MFATPPRPILVRAGLAFAHEVVQIVFWIGMWSFIMPDDNDDRTVAYFCFGFGAVASFLGHLVLQSMQRGSVVRGWVEAVGAPSEADGVDWQSMSNSKVADAEQVRRANGKQQMEGASRKRRREASRKRSREGRR